MRTMHPVLKRGGLFWDQKLLPPACYAERFARIRSLIAESGDDAWLLYGDVERYGHAAYFSNFLPRTRSALALVPRSGAPAILVSVGQRDIPAAKTLTWIDDLRPFSNIARQACAPDQRKGAGKGAFRLGWDRGIAVAQGMGRHRRRPSGGAMADPDRGRDAAAAAQGSVGTGRALPLCAGGRRGSGCRPPHRPPGHDHAPARSRGGSRIAARSRRGCPHPDRRRSAMRLVAASPGRPGSAERRSGHVVCRSRSAAPLGRSCGTFVLGRASPAQHALAQAAAALASMRAAAAPGTLVSDLHERAEARLEGCGALVHRRKPMAMGTGSGSISEEAPFIVPGGAERIVEGGILAFA